MSEISVRQADLQVESDRLSVVELIDAYAQDPMGLGEPLSVEVKERLGLGLQQHPTALALLAFDVDRPVGIALCFVGFSSFKAKPLLNIHDLAVVSDYRGKGVGRKLLAAAEQTAKERGHCAVTLEVDEQNQRAQKTYLAAGYRDEREYVAHGRTFFMKKLL